MFEYKTWKFRLMSGYSRRKAGAWILHRAMNYQSWPKTDREAAKLIESILHRDGNFYCGHNRFPRWRQSLESSYDSLCYKLRVLGKAIVFSDEIGFTE
jgi:hypothetical protein